MLLQETDQHPIPERRQVARNNVNEQLCLQIGMDHQQVAITNVTKEDHLQLRVMADPIIAARP